MLDQLENQRLEVALVPAPDQRHTSHFVRVPVGQNPTWFQRLNRSQRIRRDRVARELARIAETGELRPNATTNRLRSYLEQIAESIQTDSALPGWAN